MSQFITPPVAFTTFHGEKHVIGVTSDWEVFEGETQLKRYLAPAAVVILGIISSMDEVVTRDGFYQAVFSGYDSAVELCDSKPVPEITTARTGTNIGGRLGTILSPKSSEFRTNVLQLPLGIQKRLLICRDPSDIELVEGIIGASSLSKEPENNTGFQARLLKSYQSRRLSLQRMSRTETIEYVPEERVVEVVGAHIFGIYEGGSFTIETLMQDLHILVRDIERVENVLLTLMYSGFIKQGVNGDSLYVRTDKLKDGQ